MALLGICRLQNNRNTAQNKISVATENYEMKNINAY